MASEFTNGPIKENMRETGLTTKWKAMENFLGLMAENTKDNI